MTNQPANEAVNPVTPEASEAGESEVQPEPVEETVDTLKTRVGELETVQSGLETKLKEAEEGIKVHQRGSTKAREDLQRVQDMRQSIEAQGQQITTLSTMVAELLDKSEGSEEEEVPTKRGKYSERVVASRQEAAKQAATEICTAFQSRAEATGLPQDDPRIVRVRTLVTTATSAAQIRIADDLMKELEAGKKPENEPKEPTETEEQRIERLVQEGLHEAKKAAGLLEGEPSGVPSGAGIEALAKATEDFNKGLITEKQLKEIRQKTK